MTTFAEVVAEVASARTTNEQHRDELRRQLLEMVAKLRTAIEAGEETVNVEVPIPVLDVEPDAAPAAQLLDFVYYHKVSVTVEEVYEALDADDLDRADELLSDRGPLATLEVG